MKRTELVRVLATLRGFPTPEARSEQVTTPPEAAAILLEAAQARDDLEGRTVLDLGCGPGILGIGAALLGARPVRAIDSDLSAIAIARANAAGLGVGVEFHVSAVEEWREPAETVVMNPPFGAQRRHADRPFWDRAGALATRAIYAFSLSDSRTFIERWAVAHAASIDLTQPVRWDLPATFPHHRKPRVALPVDLWVLRRERTR